MHALENLFMFPPLSMKFMNMPIVWLYFRSVDIVGVPEPERVAVQAVGAGGAGVVQHQSCGPPLQIRRQYGRGEYNL